MDFYYPPRPKADRQVLDLSEMIALVTEELTQAEQEIAERRRQQGTEPVMRFKEAQLELGIEVATTNKAEATLGLSDVKVFTLGAERNKTNTNTITLTFERLEDGGKQVFFLDRPSEEDLARDISKVLEAREMREEK
jgi:hypothetical protein